MHMSQQFVVLFVLLALVAATSASLTCYSGVGNTVTTTTVEDPTYICLRYDFTCSPSDGACTAEEGAKGVTKTAYIVSTQDTCNTMRANPTLYRNVYCCSTNQCNAPIGSTSFGVVVAPVLSLVSMTALYLAL